MTRIGPIRRQCKGSVKSSDFYVWNEALYMEGENNVCHSAEKMEEDSLAREMYDGQRNHGWPGLAPEVAEICHDIGLDDVNEHEVANDIL